MDRNHYGSQYGYGAPLDYGTGNIDSAQIGQKGAFMNSRRQRMNILPILSCMFIPCGLFATVFYTVSFQLHYKEPGTCWFVVLVALLVVLLCGASTVKERLRMGREAPTERAPSWGVFMFISLILAWLLAMVAGHWNYNTNLKPYYEYTNLNTYNDVYPNRVRGQQIMDAGAVLFAEGSRLEIKHSQGFRNGGMYCVAPITYGNASLATYDFWAVGKDCCSGTVADFHCQNLNDAFKGAGGLRLLRDDERPFYRLAVQQAEASYNIKAVHPLFFHWVHDVGSTVESWSESGWQLFLTGMFTYFVVQAFLVGFVSFAFSKL